MEHSVRELILEINDSHGRSISTLKPTVENRGKTIFSVKNNTDLYLGLFAKSRANIYNDSLGFRSSSFPLTSFF